MLTTGYMQWDSNGDVLVYFGHKGQVPHPHPSFRLSSHIIEATESRFLTTLLREGLLPDDHHRDIHHQQQQQPQPLPPSPSGGAAPPPPLSPTSSTSTQSRSGSSHHYHLGTGTGGGSGSQPTPPISDNTSVAEITRATAEAGAEVNDGKVSYKMYFPAPPGLSRAEAYRHAVATRNVFALLYHASLVGVSLCQALIDLLVRLEVYMPADTDNVGAVLNYLAASGLDDPRNDPETAVSLLAWAEHPDVRWEEGWYEAFVHVSKPTYYLALELYIT